MERKIAINKINSYATIKDYFLAHWVSVIGLGPAMLYLQLLSYCHKGKDTAWPSIQTLNKRMGTTTKTLIKYRNTLLEYGLIKKVVKQRSTSGGYDHNLYQLVILDQERVLLPPTERLPEETEEVNLKKDTVWLNLNQISELFKRDKSVISRHTKNIFDTEELNRKSVVAKFATTATDGKVYQVDYYNLDLIISVGYRVNSKRGTQFRIWATNILKEHLVKVYTINEKRMR